MGLLSSRAFKVCRHPANQCDSHLMDICRSAAGFIFTSRSCWTDVIIVMLQVGRITRWLSRQLRNNGLEWSQVTAMRIEEHLCLSSMAWP